MFSDRMALRKTPSRLSDHWRQGRTRELAQRRTVVGLSLLAASCMGVIALYQTGVIKHLPQPPLPKLNSDKVDASDEAYSRVQTPDAVLGFGSYAVTMALAAAGGENRTRKHRWLPISLAAKALFDTFQSLRMIRDQKRNENAFCFWCLISAAATFTMLPFALMEARSALRS